MNMYQQEESQLSFIVRITVNFFLHKFNIINKFVKIRRKESIITWLRENKKRTTDKT